MGRGCFCGSSRQVGAEVKLIEDRTNELEEQLDARRSLSLDELRDLVTQTTDSMSTKRRGAIEVLKNDISFDNFSAVLAIAQDLNAIAPGFRARAAGAFSGPRLTAWLVTKDANGFATDPFIDLQVLSTYPSSVESEPTSWQSGQAPAELIASIVAACQRANLPSTPPGFDATDGLRRLVETLDTAVSVRQGANGPRLEGAVIEIIDEGWTLTTRGLEARFQSLLIPLGEFVDYVYSAQDIEGPPLINKKEPPRPDRISEATWDYLKAAVYTGLPTSPPVGVSKIFLT